MWREHGDAFQTPPTPQPQPQHALQAAEASFADLSPPGALPRQASAQEQQAATQAGTPPWQPNPVAQTQVVAASQLPSDLERPNLLSSSSHVQVCACLRGRLQTILSSMQTVQSNHFHSLNDES